MNMLRFLRLPRVLPHACLVGLILFSSGSDKGKGEKYLRNVAEKYLQIEDYTVDVKVHLDIETVQAPDMTAKVYYKTPDKVKIDSKGTFLLPKEVGVFNPRMFNQDDFTVNVEDTLQYDGKPSVRLLLSPKKESFRDRNIILTIDKSDWLIRMISTQLAPGSEMDAKISYGNFGSFQLPTRIDVNLNIPKADSSQFNSNPRRRFSGGVNGSVIIYYSNYVVNSGLSDSLFQEKVGHEPYK